MDTIIKIVAEDGARLPAYETDGAAGADLCAFLKSPVNIAAGGRAIISTGLSIEIPKGYEAQIRPRSGLAAKHGVTVLNSPGTIDSDYRGTIKIILINLGEATFTVNNGDRIAQLIIAPVLRATFSTCQVLTTTQRGEGGFGSTGV